MPRRPTKRMLPQPKCPQPAPGAYRLNALEQQISDDVDWAQTAPEVQQHEGQLVVVHRKRVLAVGTDRDALVARAAAQERCPKDELAVVVVLRADLWDIPH
jgi:hypothetical protein